MKTKQKVKGIKLTKAQSFKVGDKYYDPEDVKKVLDSRIAEVVPTDL